MKKGLPVGEEGFLDLIRRNCYYVDKTEHVRAIMESGSYVHLITRPRRFGKTLFMDTLRTFLEVNQRNPDDVSLQEELFAGLKIREDEEFCRTCMGRHPVLSITLKAIKGDSFESAMEALAETLQPVAERFVSLADSPHLTEDDRIYLRKCALRANMLDPANRADLKIFLGKMAMILGRHFGRQVVLLIDEYDVPLQKALKGGYYAEMLVFMQAFLNCLKPGDTMRLDDGRHAVLKAVLTGCLRVSKASIFTDLNNPNVNSVCTQGGPLSSAIGFTQDEVAALLSCYGLESKAGVVKAWYDGYRIGGIELYCPWDVIHFCDDILGEGVDRESFIPKNYWADTSSNDAIDEFLGFLRPDDADMMQTLCGDGTNGPGEVEVTVNSQLTYGDFRNHRSSDFWTLLFYAGYLTVASQTDGSTFRVRIPNREIRDTFRQRIQEHFSGNNAAYVLQGREIARAACSGDGRMVRQILQKILKKYVSVRDAGTKPAAENLYQGLMIGLLSVVDGVDIEHFTSNREGGDGYPDLTFTSEDGDVGVIIELKSCVLTEMLRYSRMALAQIREKHYVERLTFLGCSRYFGVGIAFSGRYCAVEIEEIHPDEE